MLPTLLTLLQPTKHTRLFTSYDDGMLISKLNIDAADGFDVDSVRLK